MFPPLRMRQAINLGGLSPRELVMRTYRHIQDHEIMTRASAVSFYAMLALVPFLGLVLFLIVQLLPDITNLTDQANGIGNLTTEQLRSTLKGIFPVEAYKVIEDQIARLQKPSRTSFVLLVAGFSVTLWLSSSLYVAIIDALNRINGVTESRSYVRIYSTALLMTLLEAVILVGSLLAIVLWPQIVSWFGMSNLTTIFATTVQWTVVFGLVLFSFALTFYVAPDSDQRWEWITPGSIGGTMLFLLGSFGFRMYVQNFSNYDKTYGSLGGVMVLLFWFWLSSLILLVAAQMNQVIEDVSPLGKNYGQRLDVTDPLDLKSIAPESH